MTREIILKSRSTGKMTETIVTAYEKVKRSGKHDISVGIVGIDDGVVMIKQSRYQELLDK